jgi:GTP-binding protein
VFVDRVRVHLRAGNGGAGVVSFVRQRGKPRGKPTGGSGGDGGAVIAEADPTVPTLLAYRRNPHHSAPDGAHGRGEIRHGKRGDDLVLGVPLGTVVSNEEGTVLADLVEPGQRVTLLPGGRGGRGNAAFLSPKMRAPTICEQGEYGAEAWFTFEMKLLADAALVGYPNAGKSTFIARASAAKPKIADYPFTTLEPNLGVVEVGSRQFVMADIPGLIQGAAEGKGLGHEFLRHVERAMVLVILLDPSQLQTDPPARQLEVLLGELERFSPELMARPRLIVVNKSDWEGATEVAESLDAMSMSAATGHGVDAVLHSVADLVDLAERQAPEREGYVLHRPAGEGFTFRREQGDIWIVEGVAAVRAVRFSDLTNPQAAELAARRLQRLGVDQALADAGAEAGDTVRIGELEFEFVPPDHEEDYDEYDSYDEEE